MKTNFDICIDNAINSIGVGFECNRFHGYRSNGERFCIVITKTLWYAVRLFLEFDCNKDEYISPAYYKQMLYEKNCLEYVLDETERRKNEPDHFKSMVDKYCTDYVDSQLMSVEIGLTELGQKFRLAFFKEDGTYFGILFVCGKEKDISGLNHFTFQDNRTSMKSKKIKTILQNVKGPMLIDRLVNVFSNRNLLSAFSIPSFTEIPKVYYNKLDKILESGQMIGTMPPESESMVIGIYAGKGNIICMKSLSGVDFIIDEFGISSIFDDFGETKLYVYSYSIQIFSYQEIFKRANDFKSIYSGSAYRLEDGISIEENCRVFPAYCSIGKHEFYNITEDYIIIDH
uniref:DUF3298 domain-containing protein n=1 Tax=Rhabditophanes sp. KR3021 TaxID=114890 RepID=A0AC35U214_9BILA